MIKRPAGTETVCFIQIKKFKSCRAWNRLTFFWRGGGGGGGGLGGGGDRRHASFALNIFSQKY